MIFVNKLFISECEEDTLLAIKLMLIHTHTHTNIQLHLLVVCVVTNVSGLLISTAVHCNLTQNGIDHQVCSEEVTSQREEVCVDHGLDEDSLDFLEQSPGFQRRSPPQRSVSESELSRVRTSLNSHHVSDH